MPITPPPLANQVVAVLDATTGVGRAITTCLCLAGAMVAVVGVAHEGRQDDAAASTAFLCKELDAAGLAALPYRLDPGDPAAVAEFPAKLVDDVGPMTACIVVVPAGDGPLSRVFREMSRAIAGGLAADVHHAEVALGATGPGGYGEEQLARSVVEGVITVSRGGFAGG